SGVVGTGGGTGNGVEGHASTGWGVFGVSSNGVGVVAENTGAGPALQVAGPSVFSRSGIATFPLGAKSLTVTGIPLTTASLVLAIMQRVIGGILVQAVVPDPANSQFTIYLTKATSQASVIVGWFVVN